MFCFGLIIVLSARSGHIRTGRSNLVPFPKPKQGGRTTHEKGSQKRPSVAEVKKNLLVWFTTTMNSSIGKVMFVTLIARRESQPDDDNGVSRDGA